MGRYLAGVASSMLLLIAGLFVWQACAQTANEADPLPAAPPAIEEPEIDPMEAAAPPGIGPPPPEATELTREERRFFRYDKDRDNKITRREMMASRSNAFKRLDVNGDNYLTFEEWAVRTSERFAGADGDGSGALTPAEFATTRPRRSPSRSRCNC